MFVHFNTSRTTPITMNVFLKSLNAELITVFTMWIAQIITFHQGYQHYRRKTSKREHALTGNILASVPIFAIYSFCISITPDHYGYHLTIRDCYGAYTMYYFLLLCYEHLGGENNITSTLCGRPVAASWVNSTGAYTDRFHRFCKYAVRQFGITKLLGSIIILQLFHDYRDCDWGNVAYVYITILSTISGLVALYALALFIGAVHNFIKPDPRLKFFAVLVLAQFTYWQGVALAFLESVGVIPPAMDGSPGKASSNLQTFLVCNESLVAAIVLRIAFPPPEDKPVPTVTMKTASTNSMNQLL